MAEILHAPGLPVPQVCGSDMRRDTPQGWEALEATVAGWHVMFRKRLEELRDRTVVGVPFLTMDVWGVRPQPGPWLVLEAALRHGVLKIVGKRDLGKKAPARVYERVL
jgi:hypothetical protein